MGTIVFLLGMTCNPAVISQDACTVANRQVVAIAEAICRERGGLVTEIPGALLTQYAKLRAATIACVIPKEIKPEPQAYKRGV